MSINNKMRITFSRAALCISLVLSVILINGCAKGKVPLSEDEELRKELGVRKAIKWNNDVVNQIQIFDEYGRKIEEKWQNPKGFVVTSRKLNYDDETGRLDKVHWFRAGDVRRSKYHYFYDQEGNLIEEKWLTPSGDLRTTTYYTYDEGNLIKERKKGRHGHLIYERTYTYENGNKIEFLEKNSRGDTTNRQEYDYNKEGKKIAERWYGEDGELTTSKKYTYRDGFLVEETQYGKNEAFTHKVLKDYDDNGLLIFENWVDEEGDIFFANQYTYKYF